MTKFCIMYKRRQSIEAQLHKNTLYLLLKLKNSFIHLTYAECNLCNTVAL